MITQRSKIHTLRHLLKTTESIRIGMFDLFDGVLSYPVGVPGRDETRKYITNHDVQVIHKPNGGESVCVALVMLPESM